VTFGGRTIPEFTQATLAHSAWPSLCGLAQWALTMVSGTVPLPRVLHCNQPCYQDGWYTGLLYASLIGSDPCQIKGQRGWAGVHRTSKSMHKSAYYYANTRNVSQIVCLRNITMSPDVALLVNDISCTVQYKRQSSNNLLMSVVISYAKQTVHAVYSILSYCCWKKLLARICSKCEYGAPVVDCSSTCILLVFTSFTHYYGLQYTRWPKK